MKYPRVEWEMSEGDLKKILAACTPVVAIMVGGHAPASPQENANAAWAELGRKMGFDPTTVIPIPGKGYRSFMAVPTETYAQYSERVAREDEARRVVLIADHKAEIERRQEAIRKLEERA
jgi:hypothetical protein